MYNSILCAVVKSFRRSLYPKFLGQTKVGRVQKVTQQNDMLWRGVIFIKSQWKVIQVQE
uniref:Uncharacterized protein n=1 Tax=Rhizophagus irregularis (strain DAOM 181602 / DAOM 197198 / MUCL 43194) TaxID=747089 RepID=U9UKK1_RHIID